jgi:hypothetical protein
MVLLLYSSCHRGRARQSRLTTTDSQVSFRQSHRTTIGYDAGIPTESTVPRLPLLVQGDYNIVFDLRPPERRNNALAFCETDAKWRTEYKGEFVDKRSGHGCPP